MDIGRNVVCIVCNSGTTVEVVEARTHEGHCNLLVPLGAGVAQGW